MRWLAIGASVLVLAAVIAAFVTIGGPAHQRSVRFDRQRVSDLMSTQSQIIYYWQQKGVLPQRLSDLNDSISGFRAPNDPQTGQPYEYNLKSDLSFELCANFQLAGENSDNVPSIPESYVKDPYSQNWNHGAGRACFMRTIDPQLYKPVRS